MECTVRKHSINASTQVKNSQDANILVLVVADVAVATVDVVVTEVFAMHTTSSRTCAVDNPKGYVTFE